MATRPTLEVEFYDSGGTPVDREGQVHAVVIRVGKQRLLDRHVTATCVIEMDAETAYLDPTSGSALYGLDTFVVVSATGSGAARRIFSGWVTDSDTQIPNDNYPVVGWMCHGPFHRLTGVTFPTATFATTNEDDVDDLLDAIVAYAIGGGADLGTWVLSGDGTGGTAHEIDATGDTLSVLQTLAAQADGDFIEEFWNDPDKQVFRFIARNRRYNGPRFTFTDNAPSPPTSFPYDESKWRSRPSTDLVRNSVTVTPNGLTAQTATDAASITAHGKREHSLATYHVTEAAALVAAEDLVAAYAEPPAVNVPQLVLEPDAEDDADLWDLVVDTGYESASGNGPRIGDRIEVTRTGPNGAVTRECVVTGYQHEIRRPAAGGWVTTLFLADAEASADAWIWGTSEWGTGRWI